MRDVVFVPGLICTADLYAAQLGALAAHARLSVADHTRHDTIEAIAADILAQAPARFSVVGLSMGGMIAFAMLRAAPERIERVVLIDTNARPDRPDQTDGRRGIIALAEAEGMRAVAETMLPRFLAPARQSDPDLRARIIAMAEATGVDTFRRQQEAIIARPDSRPGLARIACPVLVIVGALDTLTPPILSEEIAAGIAGARLETIPECGHLPTMETPELVNRLLEGFLL